jgi:Ca2+-transporting ATPase
MAQALTASPIPPTTSTPTLPVADALKALGSTPGGLSPEEAAKRHEQHGPNALPEGRQRSRWRMLADQFADFMILVLVAAAVWSRASSASPSDTIAIFVIVLLNAVIGFVQEWRAERAMAALRLMAAPSAHVRRDGAVATLPADQLVPGDIVLLEAGNVVPADLRLIEAAQTAPVGSGAHRRIAAGGKARRAARWKRRCRLATAPTWPSRARWWPAVAGSASSSPPALPRNSASIARLLEDAEEVKTPLQKRLARFGMRLAWAVLAHLRVVFVAGLIARRSRRC